MTICYSFGKERRILARFKWSVKSVRKKLYFNSRINYTMSLGWLPSNQFLCWITSRKGIVYYTYYYYKKRKNISKIISKYIYVDGCSCFLFSKHSIQRSQKTQTDINEIVKVYLNHFLVKLLLCLWFDSATRQSLYEY